MTFFELEKRSAKEVAPGVRIRTHWGDRMLISVVDLDPEALVPDHSHPNEQAGVMLSGELSMTINGETRELAPGDAYLIPGGMRHAALAGAKGARVFDVFSPVREDYMY